MYSWQRKSEVCGEHSTFGLELKKNDGREDEGGRKSALYISFHSKAVSGLVLLG